METLKETLEALKHRRLLDELEDGKWIAMTIFPPVWAALTTRYRLRRRLGKEVKKDSEIVRWHMQSQPFLPAAVVLDLDGSFIGESTTRWGKLKLMRDWEIDLRNARFPDFIKKRFDGVQRELEGALKNKSLNEQIQVAKERLYGSAGGPFCFRSYRWWAMDPRSFHPISPCHTCRALYADVKWYGRPGLSKNKTFRGGQDEIVPWRCAEADVYAQRMELTKGNF
jgi:hypothetical protein